MSRPAGRLAVLAVALGSLAVLVPAAPALADGAEPGNTRSTITTVVPAVAGLEVAIVGGDSFLRLGAPAGSEVLVLGYSGEPYLRFLPDGTVQENRRSPAVALNETRFGTTASADADPEAAPEWVDVATGGSYLWHDHRSHWMARTPAPRQEWEVPLFVDGRAVTVRGVYQGVPAPASWPWWVAAAAAGVAAFWQRRRLRFAALAGALAAGAALAVGLAEVVALPGRAGSGPTAVALPLLALAATLAALVRPRSWAAGALVAGGGVAAVVWAARRVDAFSSAVLVTDLPGAVERAGIALAAGGGAGAVAAGLATLLLPPATRPADARRASPAT